MSAGATSDKASKASVFDSLKEMKKKAPSHPKALLDKCWSGLVGHFLCEGVGSLNTVSLAARPNYNRAGAEGQWKSKLLPPHVGVQLLTANGTSSMSCSALSRSPSWLKRLCMILIMRHNTLPQLGTTWQHSIKSRFQA